MKLLKPSTAFGLLRQEIVNTKEATKFLFMAMLANISFLGFVPYITQAITIILLVLFLNKIDKAPILLVILATATIIFQAFWIPFTSQLITLVLLGLIYILLNYLKSNN